MDGDYLDLVGEGYMGSMQWQLGREMGTIPAFASRTQENQENLSRWSGTVVKYLQIHSFIQTDIPRFFKT
jgi:hypothetical protein